MPRRAGGRARAFTVETGGPFLHLSALSQFLWPRASAFLLGLVWLLLLLFLFAPSVGTVTTATVDGIRRSKATTNHGVCGGGGMLRFVSIRVLSVVCVCRQEQWVVRSIDQSFERETTRCFVALLSRARNQTGAPVTLESGVAWQWDKPDVLVLTLRILQPFGSSLRLVEQWREHALSLSLFGLCCEPGP